MSDASHSERPARPTDPYLVGWAEFRRRRKQLFFFGSWPLVTMFALWVFCEVTGAAEGTLFSFVVIATLLLTSVVVRDMSSSLTCPRCGEAFYRRGKKSAAFPMRHCWNCGIKIGTSKDPP